MVGFYHTSTRFYISLLKPLCSCFRSLAWLKKNPASFDTEMTSGVDVESCKPYSFVCASSPLVHEHKLTLYTSVRRMAVLYIYLVTNLSYLKPTAVCRCSHSLFRRREQSYSFGTVTGSTDIYIYIYIYIYVYIFVLLQYPLYRILCMVRAIHLGHAMTRDDLQVRTSSLRSYAITFVLSFQSFPQV
jgi:hypothetical protein